MATILVVSAHPDDETLFAGGTLAMYAGQGHSVILLETTRGEGGEVGEPPLAVRENLGLVREAEMREAARALGARDVLFLPYVDPHMEIGGTPHRIDVPLEDFAGAIAQHVERIGPHLVMTHGSAGEYGHPQHVHTHRAVRLALEQTRSRAALMSWAAWHETSPIRRILNRDDRAHIVRDVTPWLEAKIAAVMCHRTQHAMFLRNSGAPAVEKMVWSTESFHIWSGPLPPGLQSSGAV